MVDSDSEHRNRQWLDRWLENRISFHEGKVNELLAKFGCSLSGNILVPLCGKSMDLLWLAQKARSITGVELSEIAVQQFFSEAGMAFSTSVHGSLVCYESADLPSLKLMQGDFFKFYPLSKFDCVYDRAALVALPQEIRAPYANHLVSMLVSGGKIILISFEYEGDFNGPPFSISEAEIRSLYASAKSIKKLASKSPDNADHLKDKVQAMSETLYEITFD